MTQITPGAPIETPIITVRPDWIDPNGHMNVAFYLRAFDLAADAAFEIMGLGWKYTESGRGSCFSLETRIRYVREVFEGDPLKMTGQLLDLDEKRTHFFMRMHHATEGYLAAEFESLGIHVDLKTRRSTPFPPDRYAILKRYRDAHSTLAKPDGFRQVIGIRRKAQAGAA